EKILTGDESLPANWPVEGTTGYDFLNRVNGLFVNSGNRQAFDQLYHSFTGCYRDFNNVVAASKQQMLLRSFSSELNALTRRLQRLAAGSSYAQDFTSNQLREALTEMLVALPVYRTYVAENSREVSGPERDHILVAFKQARTRNSALDAAV